MKRLLTSILCSIVIGANACPVKDTRACSIVEQIGHTITITHTSSNIIAEYEWVIGAPDIIHISSKSLDLDYDELFFIIAHEIGHSVNKHGLFIIHKALPNIVGNELELLKKFQLLSENDKYTEEINHTTEYEADTFAVRVCKQVGIDPIKIMKKVFTNNSSDFFHPSKRNRIKNAEVA